MSYLDVSWPSIRVVSPVMPTDRPRLTRDHGDERPAEHRLRRMDVDDDQPDDVHEPGVGGLLDVFV